MIIYFDGGCRPNPGLTSVGVVAEDGYEFYETRGQGTNNLAEWLAIIEAAAYGAKMAVEQLTLCGDSSLVINQAAGNWKIKRPEFRPLYTYLHEIITGMEVTFQHVRRAKNLAGHLIERKYKAGF